MLNILYASFLGLRLAISVRYTLKMCVVDRNHQNPSFRV